MVRPPAGWSGQFSLVFYDAARLSTMAIIRSRGRFPANAALDHQPVGENTRPARHGGEITAGFTDNRRRFRHGAFVHRGAPLMTPAVAGGDRFPASTSTISPLRSSSAGTWSICALVFWLRNWCGEGGLLPLQAIGPGFYRGLPPAPPQKLANSTVNHSHIDGFRQTSHCPACDLGSHGKRRDGGQHAARPDDKHHRVVSPHARACFFNYP